MSRPFDVCWERITRARTHRNAIANAWNSFIEEHPYDVRSYVNDDGTGGILIEQVKPIPLLIAVEIGEFLYQLRAALDACIYETACLNTGRRPPPDENKLEFPVCVSLDVFKKASRKIVPLTRQQRDIVEAVQPYNAPSLTADELPYNFNRCLGILNDWARKDRHRGLHVIASWASDIKPLIIIPSSAKLVEFRVVRDAFVLKDESEVATFRIDGWQRGMSVKANPNLYLDIAVDETPQPCHSVDSLGQRFLCMELAVRTIVDGMSKMVSAVSPPHGP
jgi:hypothetical protein